MKLKNVPFAAIGLTVKEGRFVAAYMSTFKVTMAAERIGITPEEGHKLLRKPEVQTAIDLAYSRIYDEAEIDAKWLLDELVENHHLARQSGNLSVSTQTLALIAKHSAVDAFSPERVELATDKERVERLMRGRERVARVKDGPVSSDFLESPPGSSVSFV